MLDFFTPFCSFFVYIIALSQGPWRRVRVRLVSGSRKFNHADRYSFGIAPSSSSINFVDASGYKFSEKDSKPGKIKLKKQASGKGAKTGKLEPQGEYHDL